VNPTICISNDFGSFKAARGEDFLEVLVEVGVMVSHDARHARSDLRAEVHGEELIRAVSIRFRTEDSSDDELSLRELLTKHAHERDRTALSHEISGLLEEEIGRLVHGVLNPLSQGGGFPAGGDFEDVASDLSAIRDVRFTNPLQGSLGGRGIEGWGKTHRQSNRRVSTKHVTGLRSVRNSIDSGDGERRHPRAVDQKLIDIVTDGTCSFNPRELGYDFLAEDVGAFGDLLDSRSRDDRVELRNLDLAGHGVLNSVKNLSKNAERGRDNAGGFA